MSRYASSLYCAGIQLKKHHLSFLIGKGGCVIKGIQQEHNVDAKIHQRDLVYNLSGNRSNVDAAVAAIKKHMSWIDDLPAFKSTRQKPMKNTPDEDGWTVTGKKDANPKLQKAHYAEVKTINQYAGFDSDDDEPVTSQKRVTFAHDATGEDDVREFDKDEPASYVSNSSGDDEPSDEDIAYLSNKCTTSTAWRPRSHKQSPTVSDSNLGKSYINAVRNNLKKKSNGIRIFCTTKGSSVAQRSYEGEKKDVAINYPNVLISYMFG